MNNNNNNTEEKIKALSPGHPFYYSTYAKCKVTQSFPILITFKPLIMSKK